jgi:hypothetical protein
MNNKRKMKKNKVVCGQNQNPRYWKNKEKTREQKCQGTEKEDKYY